MSEIKQQNWGTAEWQDAHFPAEKLDSEGDAWGFRWRGREKWRYQLYLQTITPTLTIRNEQAVLDIGCALCDFTKQASKINTSNHFSGMDVSPTAIQWAQTAYPTFDLRTSAFPDIPFSGPFDLILCLEVMCYLDVDQRRLAVKRMYDLLSPGGTMMFSGVLDGGVRHHTETEVLELLYEAGFKVKTCIYHHWALYRDYIEDPLDRVNILLEEAQNMINKDPSEFATWFEKTPNSSKQAKLLKLLRKAPFITSPLIGAARWMTRKLLGLSWPAQFVHRRGARNKSASEANELILIAEKPADDAGSVR